MCNLRIRKSFHCNPRNHVDNVINQFNLSKCISCEIFSFINKMSNLSTAKFFWQNFGNSENIPRKFQAGKFKIFIQEWDILASLTLFYVRNAKNYGALMNGCSKSKLSFTMFSLNKINWTGFNLNFHIQSLEEWEF